MIKHFCRTAHLDEFKEEIERKKSCKEQIHKIKEYTYETGIKTRGEKKLESEYKDIWTNMKSGKSTKYEASDRVLENIRLCLRTGNSFYVSFYPRC